MGAAAFPLRSTRAADEVVARSASVGDSAGILAVGVEDDSVRARGACIAMPRQRLGSFVKYLYANALATYRQCRHRWS